MIRKKCILQLTPVFFLYKNGVLGGMHLLLISTVADKIKDDFRTYPLLPVDTIKVAYLKEQ